MAEPLTVSTDDPPDVRAARRDAAGYAAAFADASPRLTRTQALVAAERCLYCFDAPCMHACPTGIDVPSFIRRISEDNLRSPARTILESNPLGGTCARVCPTEELYEEVCVKVAQEGKPVEIGRLQRYAVDAAMDRPVTALFARAASTGKRIAVVGAGPAGLACAFGLARLGHEGRHPRREAARRRPQRIRSRDLQDGRRLRPGRDRLADGDRRHRGRARLASRERARSSRRCARASTRCISPSA